MGDQWWIVLLGCAMWAVMLGTVLFGRKTLNPDACPRCKHEAGLDDSRRHCPEQDDYNGWASDRCDCDNDYHWNYESTAV